MTLIWRYAWANFITLATLHRPFPLPDAIWTFALAAVVAFISLQRGWRIIGVLGLQVAGFALVSLRLIYVFSDAAYPFWHLQWFSEFIARAREPLEWLYLVLIVVWAIIFWLGGLLWMQRPREHDTLCRQFDLGLAFFFLLFITKFLMRVKEGLEIADPLAQWLLVSFLLFSVLAIALARNQSQTHREFMAGYKGIGIMASFALIILVGGGGIASLFAPYLSLVAEVGYGVLKTVTAPLGTVVITVLRFFFTPRAMRDDPPSPSRGTDMADTDNAFASGTWVGPLVEVLRFVLIGLAGLLVLVIVAMLVWFIARWLFAKTPAGRKRGGWQICDMLTAAWRALVRLWRMLVGLGRRKKKGVVQFYAALQRWGGRSGVPHVLSETPAEYGARLKHHFPALQRDVEEIIELFNRHVYGELALDRHQVARAQAAWRHARSPRYWAQRLKIWLRHPG